MTDSWIRALVKNCAPQVSHLYAFSTACVSMWAQMSIYVQSVIHSYHIYRVSHLRVWEYVTVKYLWLRTVLHRYHICRVSHLRMWEFKRHCARICVDSFTQFGLRTTAYGVYTRLYTTLCQILKVCYRGINDEAGKLESDQTPDFVCFRKVVYSKGPPPEFRMISKKFGFSRK